MTALLNNSTKFTGVLFTALVIFLLSGNTAAQQDIFYSSPVKTQINMINNLEEGLKSENEGLRRSSIYLSAYYQIKELVNPLAENLEKVTDSKERVLLLLALYKIGGDDSYRIIQEYVMNGNDIEASRLAKSILNEFAANSSNALSVIK
jgi:hypothetical protein